MERGHWAQARAELVVETPVNTGEQKFQKWSEQVGEVVANDVLNRICEASWHYDKSSIYGIDRIEYDKHDAINVTAHGEITVDGVLYGFVIENGDRAGTVIHEWDVAEKVDPYKYHKRSVWTLVPLNDNLQTESPALWSVYQQWKQQSWFVDLVRHLNYDRYFAPGVLTEQYYQDQAAKRGLKIVCEDHEE